MDVSDTMRIVILGETGVGRSSLANAIFGEELFKVNHTFSSETTKCEAETKSVNGRSVTLVDTPGFFDTHRSEEELKPEIVRCITECAPGPHAFLIVLKMNIFTEQEQVRMNKIQEYFSEEAFKYATVVFTHGDQLPEGETIETFVRNERFMSDLVKKCGGRCHVVDNKYWRDKPKNEYRSNQFQVEELLKTIDKMVTDNNGGCYTTEMLLRHQAEGSIFKYGIERGAFVGCAVGVTVSLGLGLSLSTVPAAVAAGVVGAMIGGVTGYFNGNGADTPQEAGVVENDAQPV